MAYVTDATCEVRTASLEIRLKWLIIAIGWLSAIQTALVSALILDLLSR